MRLQKVFPPQTPTIDFFQNISKLHAMNGFPVQTAFFPPPLRTLTGQETEAHRGKWFMPGQLSQDQNASPWVIPVLFLGFHGGHTKPSQNPFNILTTLLSERCEIQCIGSLASSDLFTLFWLAWNLNSLEAEGESSGHRHWLPFFCFSSVFLLSDWLWGKLFLCPCRKLFASLCCDCGFFSFFQRWGPSYLASQVFAKPSVF